MQKNIERNIVRAELKERLKRKVVNIPANLINGSKLHRGVIVNLSSRGIGMYVKTESVENSEDYVSGTLLDLAFTSPIGERLSLRCKVKWTRIHNIPAFGLIYSLGMEVIDPPAMYNELFQSLSSVF